MHERRGCGGGKGSDAAGRKQVPRFARNDKPFCGSLGMTSFFVMTRFLASLGMTCFFVRVPRFARNDKNRVQPRWRVSQMLLRIAMEGKVRRHKDLWISGARKKKAPTAERQGHG
jgi:hypothetical protein